MRVFILLALSGYALGWLVSIAMADTISQNEMVVLTEWVAEQMSVPSHSVPSVRLVSENSMADVLHRTNQSDFRKVFAVYSNGTIYLTEDWTGDTLGEQSILVHEIVHYLQDVNDLPSACPAEREKDAYTIQNKWLREHGFSLQEVFGLSLPETKLRSLCYLPP